MMDEKVPPRMRTFIFLISGLADCLIGGILLLDWLGFLPSGWLEVGIPPGWAGVAGAILAVAGLVVVAFQVSKLREPGE